MALANVNAPRGFTLLRTGGKTEPVRRERAVDASSLALAIGDAYVLSGNTASRAVNGSTVAGIVEGFKIAPTAASPNGPESVDYAAVGDTGLYIIGIEDNNAEFVVQADTYALSDAGSAYDISGTVAPSATLRRSRQSVLKEAGSFIAVGLLESTADNSVGSYAKIVVKMTTAI